MARPFGGGGWLFALWPLTVTAHVGETLATSPCARLRQQLGDDVLHSLLSLDLPSFDLPSLSVSLLGLLSKELTEEFLHLAEVSQDLLRSSCTGAPSPPSLSAVAGPLITRVADLERLEQSQSLAEGLGDFSGIEELFHQAMAHPRLPEESTEVFHLLLRGSELLSQQLAQLKDALQASLQRALVLEPGPELRAQLRRLLPQWALHRLGPGVPSTPVRRPHALCREDLGHLSSTAESFRDAAGRSPPGTRSARAWLRRVERAGGRLARQVVSVLPSGMTGSPPCASAHGVLYNPTSCLIEEGWSSVTVLVEGQAIFEAFQELHAPGVSLRKPVTWPVEEAADVLFVHPMAGNCALLDSLLQSLPRVEDLPKLLYVGINPLLPPPMLVVPDFVRHWQKHQTLSQKVMDSHTEEPDAWAVRSMTSHILAQCSLSQVTKMLSRYRLLQVEHLFAVFAHQSLFRALQLEEPGHVAEFEAWRGGWFCSPLAASLFSLEQFGVPDERWLAIGAMDEEESQAAAEEASCSFLAAQELQAEEAYMRCGSRRTSWAQGLAMEGIDLRRQRVQWVLRQPVLPGVVLELSKTGRGYCSDECECFAPWRGLLCDTLDAGGTTHRRNYSAAIQYIVNEDPTHLAELRHSLRNLWRHFNQKFDYPVQIFHDGLSDELRAGLVRSSSNRLWFHHLPKDFIPEPHQLPPELSVEDEHRSVSHTFSAGYRAQCRFRSGPLFEHPAVATLDYLMSLDTDSMFPREVNWDPIEAMHGNGSRVLGYSSLLVSSSAYVRGLWPAVLQFLAYEGLDLRQGRAPEHFLRRFLVDQDHLVAYNGLVVMTDFELLRVSFFKPGSDYFRFYRFIDELGGFWLYRWGDHAIRGLGTAIALWAHEAEEPRLLAYDLEVPYAHQATCFCHDPQLRCVDAGKEAAGELLWPEKKKVWHCTST